MRIYDIGEFRKLVKKENIDIAVVAVPAESAQSVVNAAVQAGIRAILNFSPGTLKVPPGVKLKNVDLTVSLESLSFFLARGGGRCRRRLGGRRDAVARRRRGARSDGGRVGEAGNRARSHRRGRASG